MAGASGQGIPRKPLQGNHIPMLDSQSAALPAAAPVASGEVQAADQMCRIGFRLHADADPGTLPRVLELFAKRGLIPGLLQSELLDDGATLDISVEVSGLLPNEVHHVENCLRALPLVIQVSAMEELQV